MQTDRLMPHVNFNGVDDKPKTALAKTSRRNTKHMIPSLPVSTLSTAMSPWFTNVGDSINQSPPMTPDSHVRLQDNFFTPPIALTQVSSPCATPYLISRIMENPKYQKVETDLLPEKNVHERARKYAMNLNFMEFRTCNRLNMYSRGKVKMLKNRKSLLERSID